MTAGEPPAGTEESGAAAAARAGELRTVLRALTAALALVAVLALVFTTAQVTRFAVAHGIPASTAWLLDPMVALALAAALLTDARLADHGARPPAWGAVLRWYCGIATLVMNTWTSWFPDGQVGVPQDPDVAGIILHSIPPVLLVLLSEAVAAYRRRINELLAKARAITPPAAAPPLPPADPAAGGRPVRNVEPSTRPPARANPPPAAAPVAAPTAPAPPPAPAPAAPPGHTAGAAAGTKARAPGRNPPADTGTGDLGEDLYVAAWRLDRRSRALTGRPASVRMLRRQLRVGQERAVHLRAWLAEQPYPTEEFTGPPPGQGTDPRE